MADTAVSIGCRKTIEIAGRLSAWLDRSDVLASEIKPVVSTALERATLDLRRVMRSIEYPPCVGLVGGPDLHKMQLTSSSVFQEGATTISELSQLRNRQHGFGQLLEGIGREDLGAAIRLRHAGPRAAASGGQRFPIQVELLNTLDIVKIIVAAYYTHHTAAFTHRFDQNDIERAISQADAELSTAAVSGLSPEDISNLRQHLWTQFPRVEGLRTLSTSGYWDWLAKHVAYLTLDGRCNMLAYLWHFEPNFTALFKHLTDVLRDLGYASSVHVPIEAMLGVDADAGAAAPHQHSLVRQSTTHGMLRDGATRADLAVSISQGTVRNTSRAVIAALTHTVNLKVNRSGPFPLDVTDLKIFPSPSPLLDVQDGADPASKDDTEAAGELVEQLYTRTKSSYVFSRSCTSNELSAVIVLADTDEEPDDIHMPAIADWIELSEGADPRARERMENCLAILVRTSSSDDGFSAGRSDDGLDRNQFLADLLGENNRWAQEWTPGQPFSQIHFVPTFDNPASRAASAATAPESAYRADDGVFPARAPTVLPPTMATSILLDIAANSSQVIRVRQIRRQLATIQRAMQARIFRYHRSNNPAQFTDWRRQIANVATKRLEACLEQRQLGNLLAILTLSEAEVQMLLAGLKGGSVEFQEIDEYSIDMNINIGRASLPEPGICAEATVAAWLKLMHEAAGSRHLCSQLNIAQPVFQHIIDEIAIGVHRADVVGNLTAKFVRTLEGGTPLSDLPRCYAVVAARTLGGFLERLSVSPVAHQATGEQSRLGVDGQGRTPTFTHREQLRQPPRKSAAGIRGGDSGKAGGWPALFRRMVEDNIIGAEGLTAHSDADHELGEYLSMLTSNPLEVEL